MSVEADADEAVESARSAVVPGSAERVAAVQEAQRRLQQCRMAQRGLQQCERHIVVVAVQRQQREHMIATERALALGKIPA